MDPLIDAFFERDLTDPEDARLEALLLEDAAAAQALWEGARRRYRAYGLPDPGDARWAPAPRARAALRWTAALALAAGLLLGLVLARRPGVPMAEAKGHLAWSTAAPEAAAPGSRLGFARRPSAPPVDVRVTLPREELVVVRVVAADGAELRLLGAGLWEAGDHRLTWDRRDAAGRTVAGNAWTVRMDEGQALAADGK